MDTDLSKVVRLYDSKFYKLSVDTARDIAQAVRSGQIVLSDETLDETLMPAGAYQLHKISYVGKEYFVGIPKLFDASKQFAYDYIDNAAYVQYMTLKV